jgi:sulfite dehydrogenase
MIAIMNRRTFLRATLATAAASTAGPRMHVARADAPVPINEPASQTMVKFPEKSELILLTDRPPNLEMPASGFVHDLTPNEGFFVRWHLAAVPTTIDLKQFRLAIKGHVESALNFSIDDLRKQFEPVSYVAVNQCSGNSRALFTPRVPGGQWGNGAVGNAKWIGVRLKDLLDKAKVKPGAVDVTFQGLDRPPLPTIANYVKSLPVAKASEADIILAYEMNGKEMPMLNGFPLRLIVPGWYGTYWVKALNEIEVTAKPFEGFWMAKTYRVTKNPDRLETPDNLAKDMEPISTLTVRSLFVKPEPGERIALDVAGGKYEVQGLAMDSGKGIKKVEVSVDKGKTWDQAKLDPDLGKYSWRRWRFNWQPQFGGPHMLMARATNEAGETQTIHQWNRSGYARNEIESVDVTVGLLGRQQP